MNSHLRKNKWLSTKYYYPFHTKKPPYMNKQSAKETTIHSRLRNIIFGRMVWYFTENKESVLLLGKILKNYFGNIDTDVTVERNLSDIYCKKYKT